MQFPVPQFTDIEDRIVGPLTLRQFLILLFAGAMLFIVWSTTKNIPVLIGACLIFGVPALALAFFPFNGRPMYKSLPVMVKFFFAPKEYKFKRGDLSERSSHLLELPEVVKKAPHKDQALVASRLARVEYQLKERQEQEAALAEELSHGPK